MIRFTALSLACLAPLAALADCPDPSAPLTRVSYDSGATMEVLSRDGDTVVFRQTIAKTGKVVEMTVRSANFTLSALRDGEGAVFDWKSALPSAADYTPGATFSAEAILTTPGLLPPRPFTTEVQVLGEETVTIAGCPFPALKMLVKSTEGGQSLGSNTKWVHMPTLVSLKSVVEDRGETRPQAAVEVE
ncbi:hypothetical protein LHP98_16165 [Rhodobacter sp. Har01]|uniref:hypothetical protein n=1 Tax=Rhodobacter sp. Har01 TaxID=2883999 RepID=UPI001D05CC34|nr:hypothetical protein [Rhodobacter sp. Har01]MCB6179658.1 hypothetical protein [Rhodobacter sp. Har01]